MSVVAAPMIGEQRVLLDNIRWDTYKALLEQLGDCARAIRLAYDDGRLEIMTISHSHENFRTLLGRMIAILTMELAIPIHSGGSNTLKMELRKKGLEPDECYWIKNEERMRGRKDFDVESDPPPDLAVEVDITSSSLTRFPIYAALGVFEIWHLDGEHLRVFQLQRGKYLEKKHSPAFPFLPLEKVEEFLHRSDVEDETSLMRSFARWVRSDVLPNFEAGKNDQPGRRNGK